MNKHYDQKQHVKKMIYFILYFHFVGYYQMTYRKGLKQNSSSADLPAPYYFFNLLSISIYYSKEVAFFSQMPLVLK